MSKKNKFWMISFICLGAGILLLIIGMIFGGRPGFYYNGSGLHAIGDERAKNRILEKTELDKFDSMNLNLNYTDLEIIASDGYYIEYNLDNETAAPSYEVSDKTLYFSENKGNGWNWQVSFFDANIGFDENYTVKLYVPRDAMFDSIQIEQKDGDITLPDLKADSISITDEYGDIRLKDTTAQSVQFSLEDGDIYGNSLTADTAVINDKYGDVRFDDLTAKKLAVKLWDGDLKVNQLTSEQADIENEYGDVELQMAESLEDYSLDIHLEYGDLTIPGYAVTTDEDEEMYCQIEKKDSKKWLRIHSEDGDVDVMSK